MEGLPGMEFKGNFPQDPGLVSPEWDRCLIAIKGFDSRRVNQQGQDSPLIVSEF